MISLSTIATIYKREVKGYFYTPLAYVFIGIFSLLMGLMFYSFLGAYVRYTGGMRMGAPSITVDRLAEAFYQNVHVILMFILPFFTMRLFTEESRQNTFALLLTSPVRSWELVLSKFFAAGTMLVIMLAVTAIFPAFLYIYAPDANSGPDTGVIFTTYLGLLLSGLVYVGFGLFWSSVTESQMIAVILSFGTNFGLWLFALLAQGMEQLPWAEKTLKYLALSEQFAGMSKGLFELKSIIYFASLMAVALFLTNRSIEGRSWRT